MPQLDLTLASASEASRVLVSSVAADARFARAVAWLVERGKTARVLVLGPTLEAAGEVCRVATAGLGASFGWERATAPRLAATLAGPLLAEQDLSPVGRTSLDALMARVVHDRGPGCAGEGLGRFADVADRPGLPRALARTLDELRLAGVRPDACRDRDLGRLLAAFEAELEAARLADRARVFRVAIEVLEGPDAPRWDGVLAVDAAVESACERDFVRALVRRADHALCALPEGDGRTRRHLEQALEVATVKLPDGIPSSLGRLQRGLFSEATEAGEADEAVEVLSAPGESRECVEIARRLLREAARGVPFDQMAIVLRAPAQYRAHLVEALRRASIPAHFARGTVRPDSTGRAFLALLHCAADRLSAKRFAEYLSLCEVPDADEAGRPPAAVAPSERWVAPDEELVPQAIERAAGEPASELEAPILVEDPSTPAVVGGTLRAPYRWERLLVDAAVIGGRERWERRLAGRRAELRRERGHLGDDDGGRIAAIDRELGDLTSLEVFALPLLDDLAALPASGRWGDWIERLSALATRALRRPERVVAALSELLPMADVGPVSLGEVRIALERRLTELTEPPRGKRYGRVYVASVDEVRGFAFDVVFVPGLAERIFPQKVTADPILSDDARAALDESLIRNQERSAAERLALRIAVGAARRKVVLSYPRLDVEQSRPRTPSFYGLEVLRAAEGTLPGFDELARRAERVGGARIGWPAPARARDAVDEAEHDLALLEAILTLPETQTVGAARFLLGANAYLARALRTRALRWQSEWRPVDGLMHVKGEARAALDAHAPSVRSFSPTALQHFAACPYRFVLQAIHRFTVRTEPAPIEELDPLQRGSLVHDVQYALYVRLRERGQLPVTRANRAIAEAELDRVLEEVAARYADDLAPAIDRVWQDGIDSIQADLREMLRRDAEDDVWSPTHFELSFGLKDMGGRDPASRTEPVTLDQGILLRGSIDCVEKSRDGALRATDYKTGKVRATSATKIGGGQTLQPIFYALVLEKLFDGARVDAGRLYYCTTVGEFKEVSVALDDTARTEAKRVVDIVSDWIRAGTLPAAPDEGACQYCDYKPVCGPYEELRTRKVKKQEPLARLVALRKRA